MIPYIEERREDYVNRAKEQHLILANMFCGHTSIERSMWLQLFYWAMADDIYGEHWDRISKGETK